MEARRRNQAPFDNLSDGGVRTFAERDTAVLFTMTGESRLSPVAPPLSSTSRLDAQHNNETGLIAMRSFGLSLFFLFFAVAAASAQGTARQRSACTDDAYRFCEKLVPDAVAVEHCLKANIGSLSRPCRREIAGAGQATKKKKRGRR